MVVQNHSGFKVKGPIEDAADAGAAGEVLTSAGAGNPPVWGEAPTAGIWVLSTTLSPTASAAEDTGVITAHDLWMIIVDIQLSNAGETGLELILNNDGGNNYDYRYLDADAVVSANGVALIELGTGNQNMPLMGVFYVRGHRSGAQNYVVVYGGVAGSYLWNQALSGHYQAGVADITRFKFECGAGNMTGKIKLYYMDY